MSAENCPCGHREPRLDFDQTVDAMFAVGKSLPFELRESALGGLAATPRRLRLLRKLHEQELEGIPPECQIRDSTFRFPFLNLKVAPGKMRGWPADKSAAESKTPES